MSTKSFSIKCLLLIVLTTLASCESKVAGDTGILLNNLSSKFKSSAAELVGDYINRTSYIDSNGDLIADFSWVALDHLDYYRFYRGTSKDSASATLVSKDIFRKNVGESLTFQDKLDSEKDKFQRTYYYWVEACSSEVGCIKVDTPLKVAWDTGKPQNLTATVSENKSSKTQNVNLSWTPTTSSDYSTIYRSQSSDFKGTNTRLIKKLEEKDANSFVDADVKASVYYYWVESCNSKGCSEESIPANTIVTNSFDGTISPIVDNGIVKISWNTDASSPDVYNIYRSKNDTLDSNAVLVSKDNDSSKNSYEDNVSPGTYYYWLKKCNGSECTDVGKGVEVQVLDEPSIQKVKVDNGDVVLTVKHPSSNSSSKEYVTYIYRGNKATFHSSKRVSTLSKGDTEYRDIVDSGDYYYWINSCNSYGCTKEVSLGNKVSVIADPSSSPIVSVDKDKGITVVKTDGKQQGLTFKIYRGKKDKLISATEIGDIASNSKDGYKDTSVSEPGDYYYWFKACDSLGCSKAVGPTKTFFTGKLTSKIKARIEDGIAILSWDKVKFGSKLVVYRNTSKDTSSLKKISEGIQANSTSYSDSTVVGGSKYYYWIKSCDDADICSSYSDPSNEIIVPIKVSSAPIVIEGGDGVNTIKTDRAQPNLDFKIYRGTTNDPSDANEIGELKSDDKEGYKDKSITKPGDYYYWFKNCNTSGCSEAQGPTIIKVKAAPDLSTPTSTQANNDSKTGKIKISWKTTNSQAKTEIYRATAADFSDEEKVTTTDAGVTSYADGVTKGGTYYYRVKSCLGVSCSKPSVSSSAVKAISRPTGNLELGGDGITSAIRFGESRLRLLNSNETYSVFKSETNDITTASYEGKISKTTGNQGSVSDGKTYYFWVKNCNQDRSICSMPSLQTSTAGDTGDSLKVTVPSTPAVTLEVSNVDNSSGDVTMTAKGTIDSDIFLWVSKGKTLFAETPSRSFFTDKKITVNVKDYKSIWVSNCVSGELCSSAVAFIDISALFTMVTTPDVPTNVNAKNNSSTGKVEISWKTTNSQAKTEIYRATAADFSDEEKVATVNAGATSYADGVIKGGKYYYRVKSCNTDILGTKCSKESSSSSAVITIARPEVIYVLGSGIISSVIRFGESRLKSNSNKTYSAFKSTTNDITTASYVGEVSKDIGSQGSVSDGKTYYFWIKDCNQDGSICSMPSIQPSGKNYFEFSIPSSPTSTLEVTNIDKAKGEITFTRKGPKSDFMWESETTGNLFTPYPTLHYAKSKTINIKNTKSVWISNCIGQLFEVCSSVTNITNTDDLINGIVTSTVAIKLTVELVNNKVNLKWDNSNKANYYSIYRNNVDDFSSAEIIGKPLSSSNIYTTKITGARVYYYWVSSCIDNNNCSNVSNVVVASTARLNDTALDIASNFESTPINVKCSSATFKQDCSYGRDVTHPDNSNGTLGYDFTKLDASGNVLESSARYWSCVRDNVTGLVWKNKNDIEGNPHYYKNKYEWNKWSGVVDSSNTQKICGYSDWRVADTNELVNIMNLKTEATIDSKFFPLVTKDRRDSFWASNKVLSHESQVKADEVNLAISVASSGSININKADKNTTGNVWLVRGSQTSYWGDSRYKINNDGTATDLITGLTWKRCSEGQTLSNGTCTGTKEKLTFNGSLEAGENSNFAGKSNWRVPNIKELITLIDFNKYSTHAINKSDNIVNQKVFPDIYGTYFSSTTRYNVSNIRTVKFTKTGDIRLNELLSVFYGKEDKHNTILVRD